MTKHIYKFGYLRAKMERIDTRKLIIIPTVMVIAWFFMFISFFPDFTNISKLYSKTQFYDVLRFTNSSNNTNNDNNIHNVNHHNLLCAYNSEFQYAAQNFEISEGKWITLSTGKMCETQIQTQKQRTKDSMNSLLPNSNNDLTLTTPHCIGNPIWDEFVKSYKSYRFPHCIFEFFIPKTQKVVSCLSQNPLLFLGESNLQEIYKNIADDFLGQSSKKWSKSVRTHDLSENITIKFKKFKTYFICDILCTLLCTFEFYTAYLLSVICHL